MRAIIHSFARTCRARCAARCAGAWVLLCLPCISCNSAPHAPAQKLPIVEILASTSPPPISAEDLAPRSIGSMRWQQVDAHWRPTEKAPATLDASWIDGPSAGESGMGRAGGWRVDGVDGTVDWLAFNPDGFLQLVRTESPRYDATTTFDPPLLLAPRELRGEDEFISDAMMRVVSMSTQRERDKGSARRRLRVVRGERIRTPLGEWNATVVESVFTATLGMAVATHRTTLWVVPEVGPVVERWEASVQVLGIPVPRDRGTSVRIDPPPTRVQGRPPTAPH